MSAKPPARGPILDAFRHMDNNVEHMGIDLLGTFEQLVLMALVRLGDGAYGRTLHQEMEKRLEKELAIGQVYVTLGRLEEKGFVTSATGEASAVRGGRAKRHFHITADGMRALNETSRALATMWPLDVSAAVGR